MGHYFLDIQYNLTRASLRYGSLHLARTEAALWTDVLLIVLFGYLILCVHEVVTQVVTCERTANFALQEHCALINFKKLKHEIISILLQFRMEDEESGLVMPLYWRCQELQNRLVDAKDREGIIVRFIEVRRKFEI